MSNWKLTGQNWHFTWYEIPETVAINKMYEIARERTEKLQLWENLNNQWQLRYTLDKINNKT